MSDHDQPIAANVLDRRFAAARPNQRWVGDMTEVVIGGNAKVYLAAILDLRSRFVVGWALSAVNDRHLTLRALDMALGDAVRTPGFSITPTKAAPMPVRTIGLVSSSTGLCAR